MGRGGLLVRIIFLLQTFSLISSSSPQVDILQGKLQGKTLVSRNGRNFSAFLGVPYAEAERFQPPKLAVKREGTLEATEYKAPCAQTLWVSNDNIGEEECLHLQIFSPDLTANLPVMVYFHPGGFTVGSANDYGAEYYMDEDVVLVLVNFRLGPFGFLSMQDEILPGNNGLRDQNMALRWVQANIAQFGGDAGSVTLFGTSIGGSSVNYHMLSPQSKGLFHGGILQSGTSLNPWAMSRNPKEVAQRFGKHLGCSTKTSKDLLECLLTKTTGEILDAMYPPLVQWGYDPIAPFGAVVEPDLHGAFLAEDPELLMETGRFYKVPVIAGITEDEGILCHSAYIFASPDLLQDMNENWEKVLPITLQYDELYTNLTKNGQLEVSKKVRKFYFQERPINEETRQELTNVYSDKLFNHGVRKAALLLAKHTSVHLYIFAHNRGDYSIIKSLGVDEVQGVAHLEDISFQFANTYGIAPEFIKGSAAEKVSRNLVKLWASFAREKTPKAQWGTEQNWPSISNDEIIGKRPLQYYRIDSDTQLINEPFTDRIKFWEDTLEAAEKHGYKDEL